MTLGKALRRGVQLAVVVLIGLGVATWLIIHNLDLNRYKAEIEAYIKEETGRSLSIAGEIDYTLSLHPTIVGHGITFGNAPWATDKEMLKVDKLEASFALIPLIYGHFEIVSVAIEGGELHLETAADGRENWDIGHAGDVVDEAGEYIDLRYRSFATAGLTDIDLTFRDGDDGTVTPLMVDTMVLAATGDEQDATLDYRGTINGQAIVAGIQTGPLRSLSLGLPVPLRVTLESSGAKLVADGRVDDLIALTGVDLSLEASGPQLNDVTAPFALTVPETGRFDVAGTIKSAGSGGSQIDFSGSLAESGLEVKVGGRVADIAVFDDFDFKIAMSGPELAGLGPLFGFEIDKVGAYAASGELRSTATEISAGNIDVKIGRSDVKGSVTATRGDRPKITVDLRSGVVDATELWPVLEGDVETKPSQEVKSDVVFSDQAIGLDALKDVDADISLNVDQLYIQKARIDLFHTKVNLDRGILTVEPLEIDYRKSTATARLRIDVTDTPAVELKLLVQNFDLGRLLEETQVTDLVEGNIDIGLDVQGTGDSARQIVAGLDGNVSFVMGQGEISSKYIDLIAVDLTRFLMPWRRGLSEAKVKCILGQFTVKKGVATSQALLFDTREMMMTGSGTINLETEKLDLLLKPRPKDPSLFSLATNLRVGGTLSSPVVSPDTLSLVGEIAEAVAGVLLLGPAGILIPFASLGAGDHHPCVNDLQNVFGTKVATEIGAQPK